MSSGLEIQESSLEPDWVGKRLWINLASLGFESLHSGGAIEDIEPSDGEERNVNKKYASSWLQHIALMDDMQSEHPGIRVRNLEGCEGVDYLSPGALTNFVSYVFGPIISALKKVGYEEGKNLDAAPYDWRLAPSTLEERDQYFSKTLDKIDMLYRNNKKTPVVLLCHSLGCKVGHYLLNFAKLHKGQNWIDKRIHTYMPVGAPHLGAPTAIRSPVSGEKMGLEAFLSDEEALIFGRSLGSAPWLFPSKLPSSAPTNAIIKKEGALTIQLQNSINVFPLISGRNVDDRPQQVKLLISFGNETVESAYAMIDKSHHVMFPEKFTFSTKPNQLVNSENLNELTVLVCEPGIKAALPNQDPPEEDSFSCVVCCLKCMVCYCIWGPIVEAFGRCLVDTAISTVDTVAKISGSYRPLGFSKQHIVEEKEGASDVTLQLFRSERSSLTTNCHLQIIWEPWKDTPNSTTSYSIISEKSKSATKLIPTNSTGENYMEVSGYDLMVREQLLSIPKFMNSVYDKDPLDPRNKSSVEAPPVKRIQAIYGINVPSEIGAVYHRHKAVVEGLRGTKNYYTLDTSAHLPSDCNGYRCENGILWETKDTMYEITLPNGDVVQKQCCGDGTVPYWSLQHVREWAGTCEVQVEEIDGAKHRDILADERFHEFVINFVMK
jgi:Lecithin:cholesterol acyltransferase